MQIQLNTNKAQSQLTANKHISQFNTNYKTQSQLNTK